MIMVWPEPGGYFTATVRDRGIQCTVHRDTCPLAAVTRCVEDWTTEYMIRFWEGFHNHPKPAQASFARVAAGSATPRAQQDRRGRAKRPPAGLFDRDRRPPTVIRGAN